MALSANQLACREDDRLTIRQTPLRLRWRMADLVTADGQTLTCIFSCAARLLDSPTERQMFEEAILCGRSSATISDLIEHFHPALSSAAGRVAAAHPAADCLEQARTQLLDVLRQAAQSLAFSCGVELLPPIQLDAHSPSLQQRALETMQRQLSEERAAGQIEHVRRALDMLRQFEVMRRNNPSLRASEMLRHVTPADQGAILRTLTHARALQSQAGGFELVSGSYLLRITAAAESSPAIDRRELPAVLGPLRSVASATINDARHLLLGARDGVLMLSADGNDEPVLFRHATGSSPLGFSRPVIFNGNLWACHGSAGLVAWSLDKPAEPFQIHTPDAIARQLDIAPPKPAGPRHLRVIDDYRLIFAFGEHVVLLDRQGRFTLLPLEPRSAVAGIVIGTREIVIVHETGEICQRRRDTLEMSSQMHCGRRIAAAALLPWVGDDFRLLLADDQGPVIAQGLEDGLATQYLSPHAGARMIAATAGHVAAVSQDRQRLILWNSWDGSKPQAEILITAQTKHRIADIQSAPSG